MVAPIRPPGACQTVGVVAAPERRARLQRARLYFVADRPGLERALDGALAGGADLVQLRDKDADDPQVVEAAAWARERSEAPGALFIVNARPDLAVAVGADGVHVGQDDKAGSQARGRVGGAAIVGRSTPALAQADAGAVSGADYIAVGPVHATPTKEGRPAIGLHPIRHAAAHVTGLPWFAIGGIDPHTVGDVVAAGAGRAVIVRAIAHAADPEAVTRELRAALERTPVGAGRGAA